MKSTRDLVLTKIRHAFPSHDPSEIMAILDRYGAQPHDYERERVQLAVLKLSEGSIDRLEEFVSAARGDYRDVLAWAEYPEEFRLPIYDSNDKRVQDARRRDREQYLAWLHGSR
jgi:hypothetical protein